jgi:hypothetical protein
MFSLAFLLSLAAGSASASLLNFDDQGLTGPSTFSGSPVTVSETVDGVGVTVEGGTILTGTTNLPANPTSLYGTASFFTGGQNPITITFGAPITNFFLDVLNGNDATTTYTVADDLGASRTFDLPPNLDSGAATIGIPTVGSIITITADTDASGFFDFFVDNIRFNEDLPPELAPIPVPPALPMLAAGIIGLVALRRRSA